MRVKFCGVFLRSIRGKGLREDGDAAASGDCRFNRSRTVCQSSGLNEEEFEAKIAISLFMDFLEAQRFFVADSPSLGRSDEAEVANEEDPILVDRFLSDA